MRGLGFTPDIDPAPHDYTTRCDGSCTFDVSYLLGSHAGWYHIGHMCILYSAHSGSDSRAQSTHSEQNFMIWLGLLVVRAAA